MKLQAELDKEKHEFNLKQNGENISAEIDGCACEIEVYKVHQTSICSNTLIKFTKS